MYSISICSIYKAANIVQITSLAHKNTVPTNSDRLETVNKHFDTSRYFDELAPGLVYAAQNHLAQNATRDDFRDAPWLATFLKYNHAFNGCPEHQASPTIGGSQVEEVDTHRLVDRNERVSTVDTEATQPLQARPVDRLPRSDGSIPLSELIARANLDSFTVQNDSGTDIPEGSSDSENNKENIPPPRPIYRFTTTSTEHPVSRVGTEPMLPERPPLRGSIVRAPLSDMILFSNNNDPTATVDRSSRFPRSRPGDFDIHCDYDSDSGYSDDTTKPEIMQQKSSRLPRSNGRMLLTSVTTTTEDCLNSTTVS